MTTLARLSFQLPAAQRQAFENAYERQLVPILMQHGLLAADEVSRPTAEGIFTRLFVVETPAAVADHSQGLLRDAAWQQRLQRLAADFSEGRANELLSYHFGIYRTPAGPGRTVEAGPGLRQGLWLSLGVRDGLSNGIVAILRDRAGQLWFGSRTGTGGVRRYDGLHITTFTTADGLASNEVRALLEDRRGHLWFGTGGGGVSRYDGEGWDTFTTVDGLGSNVVFALLEDRQGHLWFGTKGGGVSRYDGKEWTTYTTADGLGSDTVRSLAEDRQGGLWVGTRKGASRFDGAHFAPVAALESEEIRAIAEDPQGNLWFCTAMNGVRRFDGTRWEAYTFADGLGNDQVYALEQDQQGNLWFGTMSGVSRYDQASFTYYTTADGLSQTFVWSVLEDRQGQLWFGTGSGVSRYDGTGFTTPEALADWNVWSIVEDRQGHLWFGDTFTKGVMCYDGAKFTHLTTADGLGDNSVWCVFADRRGHMWFGSRTGGGVSRYDGQQWMTFTTEEGLAANSVKVILEDRHGQMWFATTGGGVSRYDGQQFTSFTTEDGLAHNSVWSMLEDRQGHMWFGTRGGVSRYDGQTFQTFTAKEGLAYDHVTAIMEDRRGHLWFGTLGGGVTRYDGQVFQTLSRHDGLIFDTVQALLEDRSGNIWIGTEGGLTRYTSSSIPPKARLQTVIADQRYTPDGPIRISTSQKLVAFEFMGHSWTTRPERMAYVYQMEGHDVDWQPVYRGRVEYQDLPIGDYTFRVKAVDRDLNYSGAAQVQVSVEPDALVESLTAALRRGSPQGEFVGRSAALKKVQQQLHQVAPADLPVLILGDTGTGKGLAARILHELSPRHQASFIPVSCGAIPEGLVESELFGHERGAFTGATHRKLGKVELAKGGTLFLDEIGDMPLAAQVKLLRLLEERTFERVGGSQVLHAEVRVVAATNRDLRQMVEAGTFREDLYFRLQGFEVQLPPLRERKEDIPLLALYFLGPNAAHLDKEVTGLSHAAETALVAHTWPGNVRELQHAIESAVVVCQSATIEVDDLMLGGRAVDPAAGGGRLTLAEMERRHIRAVLEDREWIIGGPRGAALVLGLHEATLRFRMRKLGIKRPSARVH